MFEHGEKIRILPNHSCLTINLFDYYHIVKGNSFIDKWKIHRSRYA
ncbi:MAG: hypothetical protein ACFFDD_15045 [Promethearchaeota archaeon]